MVLNGKMQISLFLPVDIKESDKYLVNACRLTAAFVQVVMIDMPLLASIPASPRLAVLFNPHDLLGVGFHFLVVHLVVVAGSSSKYIT